MLDSMHGSAAIVANGRLDLVGGNELGRALYSPVYDGRQNAGNIARFNFLDAAAEDYYPDWDGAANVTVAILRTEAGRDPRNTDLRELIGELSTASAEFRTRWATHDVRLHRAGTKQFNHPDVGRMDLAYHSMDISDQRDGSLVLTVYTPEPGSDAEDRIRLLASWAASRASLGSPGDT